MYKLIIQGFPRTGSTKMWSMCKDLTGYRMYYEPSNRSTALGQANHKGNIHKIPLSNEYQDVPRDIRNKCTNGPLFSKYLSNEKKEYYSELGNFVQPCGLKEFGFTFNLYDVRNQLCPSGKLVITMRSPEAIWASVNLYKELPTGSLKNFMMKHMWEYIKTEKYAFIKKAEALSDVHKFIAIWYYFHFKCITSLDYWGEDSIIIKFEDLCDNPKEEIKRLAMFLGVEEKEIWTSIKPKTKDKWKEYYNSKWFYDRVEELGLTNKIRRFGYGKKDI